MSRSRRTQGGRVQPGESSAAAGSYTLTAELPLLQPGLCFIMFVCLNGDFVNVSSVDGEVRTS